MLTRWSEMGFGEGVFCFWGCAWWLQGGGGAWGLALWLGVGVRKG
ncbi:hypothetical protein [Riemerella anatipestifer]|nr:hypothetical protein [Riemerella anatipestifer]MCT6764437.1 hypothetical protein [Riemerella anatipestifer]MCT6766645.1 hypothetical protein [Riemerella anatipestifer]MCU7599238.1 hypothetical protein [Riemerella anatipestifer]MDR7671481.1 hypothetical protein [Riemerella anatipestifer]MDR7705837.1 hypothetical protein [Riemerella anatipestifer]